MPLKFQRINDFSAGIDSRSDPNMIQPNAFVDGLNGVITNPGYFSTRDGIVCFGGKGLYSGGLMVYAPPSGTKRLVGAWPPGLYHAEVGSVNWLQTASSVSLVYGPHAGVLGRDIDSKYLLFVHSTYDSESAESYPRTGLLHVDPSDGTCSQTFDVRPSVVTYWQDRLWMADSSQTNHYGDQLFWSRIFDGREYSLAGMNLRIDPGMGGRITSLLAARGETPRLYIFKDNGIYLFHVVWGTEGYIPLSVNQIDTTKALLQTLSQGTGCIAGQSAIWVPGAQGADAYFLASDGVRSLRRAQDDTAQGGGGMPLTWRANSVIDRINWTYAYKARAAIHDNQYLLAVPLDGEKYCNYILAKNLLADDYSGWGLWRLDTEGLVAESFPARRCFFMNAISTTDSLSGVASPTLAAHVFEITGDQQWNPGGTGFTRSLTTRDFDLEEPGKRKFWRWLELQYMGAQTAVTLVVHGRIDDWPTWDLLGYLPIEVELNNIVLPAPLPFRFWEQRLQMTKLACESLPPSFRAQLRIDDAGPAKVALRQIEMVGQILSKEWL